MPVHAARVGRPATYPIALRLTLTILTAGLPLSLGACSSLLTEGTAAGAGIAGASVAHAVGANGAVTAGIGIGAQAAGMAGVQYLEKRIHHAEQDTIAQAAGPLAPGQVAHWNIRHSLPIESNEQGEVTVSRVITAPAAAGSLDCKEIVFSVDTTEDGHPHRAFYTAAVCRDGQAWRWATAEPATERWGSLQ
ncbi:hypothetical protein [Rhodopila sp.]|uniref:hypothetical protein n=1 Tax=Rhodopila sp. TaxID=2480087 RepID=UPI002B76DF34|nr:hypothetical protein [Rhodopila sp.]HVZ07001.1 hypothetical protein [Rhodopila sp.]